MTMSEQPHPATTPKTPSLQHVELSAGTIEFVDTGGDRPVVVLVHGLLMDETLWTDVVAELGNDRRCIVPVLPLGAHRRPMNDDADLSMAGIAALLGEFIERLDLHDATAVGNDTGGAVVQLLAADHPDRLGRIALVSCDAFDNFPPGLTGRTLFRTARLPPSLFGAFMQQMRLKPVRRLPLAFGLLTKRGDKVTKGWLRPILGQKAIRHDTVKVLRAAAADTTILVRAAERLAGFDKPALIVWASEDRVMPPEHGRRLAELFPDSQLVEVADSYTLIPLDQPRQLANLLRSFTDS